MLYYDEETKTLQAKCSCCGEIGTHKLTDEELATLKRYWCYGRQMGMIQDLFPNIPAWIRSGAIDQYSNGFCICPKCSGFEDDEE